MNSLIIKSLYIDRLQKIEESINLTPYNIMGKVTRVIGMTIEATGLSVQVGAQCKIQNESRQRYIDAEVIGFNEKKVLLMPLQTLDGVKPGSNVILKSSDSNCGVGNDLLGRVVDGLGKPIDSDKSITFDDFRPIDGSEINPLDRGEISEILDTGIKSINSALTFGKGQRMGLIAGSGVGKSVLMGMLTRFTEADIVVIGLIGERGREVKEFIKQTLGEEGLKKSVIVAAPVDVSPVMRVRAAKYTHAIAEYFSEQGKNVLLLFDSLTRVAHAQREIGLAAGEPPTTKGYTPSVFSLLPKLIERAGVGKNNIGSISAFYTVLAESDDKNDPIVDLSRATLDGQIMLSRSLADSAFYPAIDLEGSISRLSSKLQSSKEFSLSQMIRKYWTLYKQKEDLIQVGAYTSGSDANLDHAIAMKKDLDTYLRQNQNERYSYQESINQLNQILNRYAA